MQNPHFLPNKPDKPNFYKNLNIFFSKYPYSHVGNTLFINDTPFKIMFNGLDSAIFLEFFYDPHGHDFYLLGTFPYLDSLHSSRFGVFTFIQHNPFSRIRCINHDDLGGFKMFFVKCSHGYKPSFCNNAKLKLKQKVPY